MQFCFHFTVAVAVMLSIGTSPIERASNPDEPDAIERRDCINGPRLRLSIEPRYPDARRRNDRQDRSFFALPSDRLRPRRIASRLRLR